MCSMHGATLNSRHLCFRVQAAVMLGKPAESLNLIVGHLGAGASVTAVQGGRSVDTSMGLTPLEGCLPCTAAPLSPCARLLGELGPAVVDCRCPVIF